MDIQVPRTSIVEYPCMDILDIDVDIHTFMENWRLIQKSRISIWIIVDFRKSKYVYAMDSRTRGANALWFEIRVISQKFRL